MPRVVRRNSTIVDVRGIIEGPGNSIFLDDLGNVTVEHGAPDGSDLYIETAPGLCPELFGAKGDYDWATNTGTDDTDAFLRMLEYATARGGGQAWPIFLRGHYLITENNVFGRFSKNGTVNGLQVQGTGQRDSSSITLRPPIGGDQYYFYDGLASSGTASIGNKLLFLRFRDLTLRVRGTNLLDDEKVHWFRQSGWNADGTPMQGWQFQNVYFFADTAVLAQNGDILRIVGDANGSENSFIECAGRFYGRVVHCTNAQAVNQMFLNCHWEIGNGDIFSFVRGGSLTCVGGSIIVDNGGRVTVWASATEVAALAERYWDGRKYTTVAGGTTGETPPTHEDGDASDGGVTWTFVEDESQYLCRFGGDGSGQINSLNLQGVRVELRSARAKLLKVGPDSGAADLNTAGLVNFVGVDVSAVSGGFRTTLDIAESGVRVNFTDGCKLSQPAGGSYNEPIVVLFRSFSTGDANYPTRASQGPVVMIRDCKVSEALQDNVTWEANATGVLRCDDCTGRVTGADLYAEPDKFYDCTLMNPAGKPYPPKGGVARPLRSRMVNFRYWPGGHEDSLNPDGAMSAWLMPPGSILEAVRAVKGTSGAAVSIDLEVTDGNGTLVEFDAATVNAGFNLTERDLNLKMPHAVTELRLVDTSANDPGAVAVTMDDFLIVEYY
jgi:hypothetical protein